MSVDGTAALTLAQGAMPRPTGGLDLEVEVQWASGETSKKQILQPSHEQVPGDAFVALKQPSVGPLAVRLLDAGG